MKDMGDNHFKVDDRVRAIRDCKANDFEIKKGKEYTVTNVHGDFLQLEGTDLYHGHHEFELVRSAEELGDFLRKHGLIGVQTAILTKLIEPQPAPAVEEEPVTKPGSVSYVEIRTVGGRTSNYLIDLAEVSTKMEPIRSLEYLLHSHKFIRVSDKAGTEKLIAVDTIEEARVL